LARPGCFLSVERQRSGRSVMRKVAASLTVLVVLMLLAAAPALAFTDVPESHPYSAAISDLSSREIISGYDDGSFGPQNLVWRQHLAKMMVLTLDLPCSEADVCPFSDVQVSGPGSFYPDNYIAVCFSHQITAGFSPITYAPDEVTTRAQVITMVVRAADNLQPGSLEAVPASFVGTLGSFDPTHGPAVAKAEYNGLLAGLQGFSPSWDPWAYATRGETAQILHNLLGKLDSRAETPVLSVIDGDTIQVIYQGRDEAVRLIGFDTPESGEPFAAEAETALRGLVGGRRVHLEFDVEERDQYQRLLAYVWSGSTLVNAEMLRLGWATLYTVPPNVKYVTNFQTAENEARSAHRGIWAVSTTCPLEIAGLHPDADGNDNFNLNDEWIEFRVLLSGSLLGYAVEDATGHRYDFPDRIFQAGQLFKLRTGAGTDTQTDLHWGASGSAIWNNGGDVVKVLDPQGHVVALRSY
jgi:micrococcal nuclease